MTTLRQNIIWIAGLATIFWSPPAARAQEPLERAQALYASAQFTDALAVLTSIQPATRAETVAAAKTRALCLIALGRTPDAEGAFETLVEADPHVRLTEAEVSPRVRALFAGVRQRVLPSLVKERFTAAKALFTAGQRDEAAAAFKELRPLLEDPDLTKTNVAGIADLRVLVDGFLALTAVADDAPAPPSTPDAASPDAALAASGPATDVDAPARPREATDGNGSDADAAAKEEVSDRAASAPATASRAATPPHIVPPVVISQDVPRPRGFTLGRQPATLVIEVLIDEHGRVERAALTQPLHPIYDALVLDATESWQYKPATRDGKPVTFLKTIEITVRP